MSARHRATVYLLRAAVVCAGISPPAHAATDSRLVLGLSVMPQLEQFIGGRSFPAELYRAELLLPVGPRLRAGVEVDARPDFVIIGASGHADFWRTDANEWRVGFGLGYTLPLADSEMLFRRFVGEGSSLLDRLHLRVGLGQTFDLHRGGAALRVSYDARLMLRDSMLSVLEGLDDGVDATSTFLVHELMAGIELRWGGKQR